MEQTGNKTGTVVGIADFKLALAGETLVTYSLGSCVGIVLVEQGSRRGGMLHAMLPSSAKFPPPHTPKYLDTALDMLLAGLRGGGVRGPLAAVLAGGANMFPSLFKAEGIADIGERNILASRELLRAKGIQLAAEDTGKDYGRTVEFNSASGEVFIKSLKFGLQRLYPR